ncbi:C40 family peptidase [Paracoccus xiamenensis]|uniref:peptidase n=1 Tax=Paracoccus xiamenensis TaxID=2714901 RepID=UPI00140A28F7|nr:peptidase [Paracoccus xiamenensis]NHF72086.1 peptidase [Paracoccus xiamenensis]
MTDRGPEVLGIARRWIGTPYFHQGASAKVGTDCLGLIRGIWRELYGAEPEEAPAYTPDWGEYGRDELLLAGAQRHLIPDDGVERIGQVLLFRMRSGAVAKHLGVVSAIGDAAAFIHAYDHHGVIESPLSMPWRQRIAARFRFP